ncbi:MAG: ATP-binding protein [Conexivisphaera sp.]|jgi:predicted AAA+ superfamily ATPase
MGILAQLTEEYIGSLKFVREIPRRDSLPLGTTDVVAVIGPRRVGKTHMMLRAARQILDGGGQALYVPMDDPSLRGVTARRLAEMAREEYAAGAVHLFLDEVQDWPGWDASLRWLHDVRDFHLYISGSSSALQSSEIPSRLRGRYISKLVMPLSFSEVTGGPPVKTFRDKGVVMGALREYMAWGGFPEIWLQRTREKVLSLAETIFYRDMVERFRVRDPAQFRAALYYVLSRYANPFTWNSLARELRAQGIDVDVKTAISYVQHMEDAFLVFVVGRRSSSSRAEAMGYKKAYVVDPAIIGLVERPMDMGRRMENIVFLELVRRGAGDIGYHVTRSGQEVDFVVAEAGRASALLEVCIEPEPGHFAKLAAAAAELGLASAELITLDSEDSRIMAVGGREVTVRAIPLWRWLLGGDRSASAAPLETS